ncbi:hypothetical protein ACRWQL_00740 (plasmid) [Shewanella sp. HL-SH4]|uniref:hypothetical protein n=1 Tax=Shewanella TaxID=22 RepID=UPI003D791505
MKTKLIIAITMAMSFGAVANVDKSVFTFNNESVTVQMSEYETMTTALNRAKEIMMINAAAKTPKFVSFNTNYDSETDKIIETGLVAQGANIFVDNVKHSLRPQGSVVFIDAKGDVTVDVTAMVAKLKGERQVNLMKSQIDELTKERQSIQGVLLKIKNGQAITEQDSSLISQYQTAMTRTLTVVSSGYVQVAINETQSIKDRIIKLYEHFVFPFIRNARVETAVGRAEVLAHDVVKAEINVYISRGATHSSNWYMPSFDKGYVVEDCNHFFLGCSRFLDTKGEVVSPDLQLYENGLVKTSWHVEDVLEPKWCGRSIYEFLPISNYGKYLNGPDGDAKVECGASYRWNTGKTVHYAGFYADEPDNLLPLIAPSKRDSGKRNQGQVSNIQDYNAALKELSNRAFWLKIEVGRETFHLNITSPIMSNFTFSVFQPRSWFNKDIQIKTSIREEQYDVKNSRWLDMKGNVLRYQNRAVIFY